MRNMTILLARLLILLVAVTLTEGGSVEIPLQNFTGKRDVVFILDSSASVGTENFQIMKNFARFITRLFTIGKTKTQFGLDVFSTTVTTEIKLNQYNNCESCLIRRITIAKYKGSLTNTYFALDHARLNSFSKSYGARTGVPKIAIVMTDGKSQDKDKTCESAKDLRDSEVTIMVIPIGSAVDENEIDCIASRPSFILPVSNFDGLKKREFRDRVGRQVFSV
ncbi:collagen alpha-1(XXI) chain-like [Mytilus californianus]|uniref:collagen alpha-1(XXI) chain-like n=1 Tax=Mytilus californianus TaxID=6549 RepID=UPI002246B928|nr:collagen alpha-1(XXI) chain-like [Mytilus californianus]